MTKDTFNIKRNDKTEFRFGNSIVFQDNRSPLRGFKVLKPPCIIQAMDNEDQNACLKLDRVSGASIVPYIDSSGQYVIVKVNLRRGTIFHAMSPGANQVVSKRQLQRKYRVARDNNDASLNGQDNIIRTPLSLSLSAFLLPLFFSMELSVVPASASFHSARAHSRDS